MASLKDIRKRISSVKNTQKVTKAMKLVAAAKLRRAQRTAHASRLFTDALGHTMVRVSRRAGPTSPPMMHRRYPRLLDFVLFTSDRGLCGGFNENLIREATEWSTKLAKIGVTASFIVLGRKGREALKRLEIPAIEIEGAVPEGSPDVVATSLASQVARRFLSGESDGSFLVYNRFFTAGRQQVVFEDLLPFHHRGSHGERFLDYLYEPQREEALQSLIDMTLERMTAQAFLDSRASELAARMRAMDNATKNAADMISGLTLLYNRARQAAITADLMDIVGGAEALR